MRGKHAINAVTRVLRWPYLSMFLGFAAIIVVGAFLLYLPISHPGSELPFLDALFTSTSAVCVTGLIVVDTGTAFSVFGQVVILVLIQVGGLGILTFAALLLSALGGRLSLRAQSAMQDSFFQKDLLHEFGSILRSILTMTFAIEAAGATYLFFNFWQHMPLLSAAWSSVFHSISAFCNAGFSIYRDSMVDYAHTPFLMLGMMALIVLGGIGHVVILELISYGKRKYNPEQQNSLVRLSLHTKIVLLSTGFLIVGGTAMIWLTSISRDYSFLELLFQSVTARTAGFNSVDIGALPIASLLVMSGLMFIGAAPGSTGGGVKVTTAMLWGIDLWSGLRGNESVHIFGRTIPRSRLQRTTILLGVAVIFNFTGLLILSMSDGSHSKMLELFFEQVSAFATVGLSTGITPTLSVAGKIWIIITMFVGRLGPLTLVSVIIRPDKERVHLPEEEVMIG